jgi:hypothetical protein
MKTEISPKQVILTAVAVIIIGVGFSLIKTSFNKGQVQNQQAALVLYFDQTQKRIFEGDVTDNMSVLQALYASSLAGNFDFRYSVERSGKIQLYKIGDKINDLGGQWYFYLNGNPINIGDIDLQKINKGDLIEAKYQ